VPEKFPNLSLRGKLYYLCANCDLLFLNSESHLSEEDEQLRYQLHENSGCDDSYREYLSQGVEFASPFIKPRGRVLDFGSGKTQVASQLFYVKGFVSESYDPYFYPILPGGKFDAVFACEVVEHLKFPNEVFQQLKDLLNEEGVLILRTMLHHKDLDLVNWWYLRDATHVVFYSLKTIEWLCKCYGLELILQEKHFLSLRLKSSRI
jgi:SAM-dependent methyltransferase